MSYAIIEDSGTQIRASVGDVLLVDHREVQEGAPITFDRVLLVGGEGAPTVGQPYVDGASVQAELVDPMFKGEKLHVMKFKRRKGYRRKTGHRQRYVKVKVLSITA